MSTTEGAGMSASDWELHHDEHSGQAYYLNVKTGESSWNPPDVAGSLQTPAVADSATRQQWVEAFDESGHAYYVNLTTMETRWTPPPTADAGLNEPHESASEAAGTQAEQPPRQSTAEQMAELNRVLSGVDDEDASEGAAHASIGWGSSAPSDHATDAAADGSVWMMFVNENDGHPYYYNHVTGECVWEPPEEFVQFHSQQQTMKGSARSPPLTLRAAEAEDQEQSTNRLPTSEQPQTIDDVEQSRSMSGSVDGIPHTGSSQVTGAETLDSASASGAIVITPEFEEKVRRAIEAVSKTPIASSRLVFVRTPHELPFPTSTRTTDGQEQPVDLQSSLSQRVQLPSSARPGSAAASLSDRQPTSVSVVKELELTLSEEQEIVESGIGGDEPSHEQAPSNQEDASPEIVLRDVNSSSMDEQISVAAPEAAVVDTPEPIVTLPAETNNLESPISTTEHGIVSDPDTEKINGTAAVVLQCAIRCFIARGKVKIMRTAQEGKEQQLSAIAQEEQEFTGATEPTEQEAMREMTEETSVHDNSCAADVIPDIEAGVEIADEVPDTGSNVEETASPIDEVTIPNIEDTAAIETVNDDEAALPATATTAATAATADGIPAEVSPMIETIAASDPSKSEAAEDPQCIESEPDVALTENTSQDQPESSSVEAPVAVSYSSSTPSTETMTPAALTAPVSSRRSSPRLTARSVKAVATVRRRDAACSTPARCPPALSLEGIFPIRFAELLRTPNGPTAPILTAASDSTVDTAGGANAVPRKLPPWMQRATRPTAMRAKNIGDKPCSNDTSSPSNLQANSLQANSTSALLPPTNSSASLLEQYAHFYNVGRQRFETERHQLLAEWAGKIHASATTSQDKSNANGTRSDSAESGPISSLKQFREAFEAQDDAENLASIDKSALGNQTADVTADPSHCSETDIEDLRRREIERRIKFVEASIGRVESQLENAELFLVTDDGQVPEAARVLQAKYASKLRRRLRSLVSATTYWRQALTEVDTSRGKSRKDTSGYAGLSNHRSWSGDSALHYAAWRGWREQVVRLINAGADVNQVDNSVTMWRPLHEASRGGDAGVVRELVAAGASLSAADASGDTALHVACRVGSLKAVCELLLSAARVDATSPEYRGIKAAVKESIVTADATSAATFFGIRNRKRRRAIDLATLPTLVAFLKEYEDLLRRQRAYTEAFETSSDRSITKTTRKKREVSAYR